MPLTYLENRSNVDALVQSDLLKHLTDCRGDLNGIYIQGGGREGINIYLDFFTVFF